MDKIKLLNQMLKRIETMEMHQTKTKIMLIKKCNKLIAIIEKEKGNE